jgi:streptogramin lyase
MVFNTTTRALSYKGHNVENDPVIQRYENEKNLLGIRADLYNNILFIQWFPDKSLPLLHRFDRNTNAVTTFNLSNELGIGYHELYGFLQQQNKRMWIYGMPVFAEWSTDRTRFFPITNNVDYKGESGIHFQRVSAGFEDKDGNLWLATDNGIYLFNPNAQFFDTYYIVEAQKRETTDASISCVWQMPNGNIFVSTYLTGLHYYDQQLNKIALPPALQIAQRDVTVWDIQQHSRTGKLWFSLQRGEKALMIYDTAKKNITWIKDSIFKKSTVRQLTEDNEGNLWFGLYGGNLIKWDYDQSGGNIEKGYSIALRIGEHINKLLVDNEGYLWIATSGAGILRINPKNNKIVARFSTKAPTGHQLLRDVVTDMIQYDNNTIAATGGNVYLIHTKTNKVTQLTSADGLPSSTAVSIQKDVNGILWLGLANGICRLNLIKKTYTLYDRKDGITYDNFEQPGAFQISGNRLLFSTPKNFITFKPSALRIDTPQPPIITSFRLANQMLLLDSILNEKRAVLQYDNSSIAIEFSNLNYLSGSKLRYYYMLEGLDKDWIRADESKQALYNYIPHGNYTFKVKSENEDGISSAHYTSLSIKVIPPFWKTWLFYGMMALLLLIIIFTIDQERMKRIRTVHQMRSQIGNDLHSDIHSTLNDINVLSSMAKMKADKDIIRSKQYIEQISEKSSTMMESMDDILWSIDPQNDSMKKMLLRIQEHNDAIKNTYSTDIVLTADEGMNKMLLNMRDRHEFLLFYKQAIQFCLQQGQQLPIHVVLTNKKGNFQLQVQAKCDNIEHDQNTLKDIKNDMQLRADALSATLEIFYTKKNITIVLQKNYRS